MKLSHDQRINALCRLEIAADNHSSQAWTLEAIDRLLVYGEVFSRTDLERIICKRTHPIPVERAVELYLMMARLIKICEPKGPNIGPACIVRQIHFEYLTREEALDLKNGIGFRLVTGSLNATEPFCGLDLLTDEEKELYEKVKPYFRRRGKPTLKILAARLLRDSEDTTFSDRAIIRYIAALNQYSFNDQNHRRDYLIHSVNNFGAHNKSAHESMRYAMAQAVMQIGPMIREQMIPLMAQTARFVAHAVPQLSNLLPQLGQSIVLMREALPALQQNLPLTARSVAQFPDVLPQLQLAVANLSRSVPQALSLLANVNLNPAKNNTNSGRRKK